MRRLRPPLKSRKSGRHYPCLLYTSLLLGRFLAAAEKRFAYGISAAGGGTCRLAIPREAKADISLGEADIKELQKLAEELQDVYKRQV